MHYKVLLVNFVSGKFLALRLVMLKVVLVDVTLEIHLSVVLPLSAFLVVEDQVQQERFFSVTL